MTLALKLTYFSFFVPSLLPLSFSRQDKQTASFSSILALHSLIQVSGDFVFHLEIARKDEVNNDSYVVTMIFMLKSRQSFDPLTLLLG